MGVKKYVNIQGYQVYFSMVKGGPMYRVGTPDEAMSPLCDKHYDETGK